MFNRVVVVGMGYVGTVLSAKLATSGFKVVGVDKLKSKVELLNRGKLPMIGKEPGLARLLRIIVREGRFKATQDFSECKNVDAILVCVETPFNLEKMMPDYSSLRLAIEKISKNLSKNTLVVIESTVAPTTTENIVRPILEKNSNLKAGEDFYLAHCPERVMPGKLLHNIETLDRVVGGINKKSARLASQLYKHIVRGKIYLTDCLTAEVVKTAENSYRDVNIAFANAGNVGTQYWIRMASNPLSTSEQIALIALNANKDVGALIWSGTGWGNEKLLSDGLASNAVKESIALEYEQGSGSAMFVWETTTTDTMGWQQYHTGGWDAGSSTFAITAMGGQAGGWLMLKADKSSGSDKLMFGVYDSANDLNTQEWLGSAWDTTADGEHDSTAENIAARVFDIEYEPFSGHEGHCILAWGDGGTVSYDHWSGSAWATTSGTVITGTDDTAVVQLRAVWTASSGGTAYILAAFYQETSQAANDDLQFAKWDGTNWDSTITVIETTQSVTAEPMFEPFMIATKCCPEFSNFVVVIIVAPMIVLAMVWVRKKKAIAVKNQEKLLEMDELQRK